MNSIPLPAHFIDRPVPFTVVGCGGNGSAFADALCALAVSLRGLGHPGFKITLVDGDTVSRFNVARQRFASCDVGFNKATVLARRLSMFYDIPVSACPQMLDGSTARLLGDVVVTCTDSAAFRATLPSLSHRGFWWLDTGVSSRNGQLCLGQVCSPYQLRGATRVPHVLDLFPEIADPAFIEASASVPSCSFEEALAQQSFPVNRAAAQHAIDLLWSWFRTGTLDYNAILFSVSPPSVSLIRPHHWAGYGYAPEALPDAA